MEADPHSSRESSANWLRSRTGITFLGFLAVALYFLWTEHRAHVIQALPYLLVLLCPLMHLFHGHGGHHHEGAGARGGQEE